MKKLSFLYALLTLLILATSCQKEHDTTPERYIFRVINRSSHDLKLTINSIEYTVPCSLRKDFNDSLWFFTWDNTSELLVLNQTPTHFLGITPRGTMVNVADSAVIEFDDGVRICYTHNNGNFVPSINNVFDPSSYTYGYYHYVYSSIRCIFFVSDYDYLMAKKAAEESH